MKLEANSIQCDDIKESVYDFNDHDHV